MKKILLVLVLLLMATSVSAVGLGVSPSVVEFEDVLRNREYVKDIKIYNTADYPVSVALEIKEHTDWFEFPEMVEIPAKGSLRVPITVRVPRRTKITHYETMAYAMVYNQYGNLNYGVGFKISVNPTKKRNYCGYVDNILTRDVKQGEPLRILVGYMNCGNIKHKVVVKTEIKEGDKVVKRFRRRFRVNAFTVEQLTAKYRRTNRLDKGSYTADVKVYLKRKLIGEKSIRFIVY